MILKKLTLRILTLKMLTLRIIGMPMALFFLFVFTGLLPATSVAESSFVDPMLAVPTAPNDTEGILEVQDCCRHSQSGTRVGGELYADTKAKSQRAGGHQKEGGNESPNSHSTEGTGP